MILDTHAIVYDALDPKRLSRRAARTIETAAAEGTLACSDISLWEIAVLVAKGRLDPGVEVLEFLNDVIASRALRVIPITPVIAVLAQSSDLPHGDPADRIIFATTVVHRARLVSADEKLRGIKVLDVVW